MNIVWGAVFTSEYCMDTASTGGYGGTVFPGWVRYSLVNNVRGVRYSLGYRIHSDSHHITPQQGSILFLINRPNRLPDSTIQFASTPKLLFKPSENTARSFSEQVRFYSCV